MGVYVCTGGGGGGSNEQRRSKNGKGGREVHFLCATDCDVQILPRHSKKACVLILHAFMGYSNVPQ